MNGEKVSIITVSYNSADTIEQTIQSVLGQTYDNMEYIIIDGNSTDGTVDIIKKYEEQISYWVSEPDDGLYDAMNKGIRQATGSIIGIINSDDWYEPDAVEKVVECFRQSGAELVHGNMHIYENEKLVRTAKYSSMERIWYQMCMSHPTVFAKKSVYSQYGGFDTLYKIAADYELMLRLYNQNVKFEYLDEVISNFREGGVSTTRRIETANEAKEIALKYIAKCPNREIMESKLQDDYKWKIVRAKLEADAEHLKNYLKACGVAPTEEMTLFGTGIWSAIYSNILKSAGIQVKAFADNNSAKWGQKFQEIEIIAPDALKQGAWNVLIATRDYAQEIKVQLDAMENPNLHYILLEEMVDGLFLTLSE